MSVTVEQTREEISRTLDMALDSGADAAEVLVARSETRTLKAQKGRISESEISSTRSIGIRVQRGEQLGISYSESWGESDRRKMVEMALANSLHTKRDPAQGIRVSQDGPYLPDCSAEFSEEQVPLEEQEALAVRLESEPMARDRRVIVVPYSGLNVTSGESFVANSLGVFCTDRSRLYSCYTYALMEENGIRADFGESSLGRRFGDLDVGHCAEVVCREAALRLEAKPLPGGSYDVIFQIDVLEALLESFDLMFCALAAKNKLNPMAGKLGEKIASETLTVWDLPRKPESLRKSYFDAEGAVPEDLRLLDRGVLREFYHNSETAAFFGVPSNGRASRHPKGPLGTGGNCTLVEPGEDAGVRSGTFLEIDDLDGLHSGCDPISGDFSLPCKGKLFVDNQMRQAVKDVTLAGNFYRMLREIQGIGPTLRPATSRSFFAPDIRFGKLSVAGD